MKLEKIIVVGAEGGRITLFGRKREDGEWQFSRETDERTLMGMMPEDDREGLCFYSESDVVSGWEAGLELISRYPWTRLYPLYVHPEFADRVMQEVLKPNDIFDLNDHHLEYWQRVCAGESRLA